MKSLLSVWMVLSISFTALAQKTVTLCESYDKNDGTTSGIYNSWDIEKSGGYVYIVYKQDKPINNKSMQLYIDKKYDSDEDYKAYETLDLTPEKGKNWVMYDYKFTEAGKYRIEVINDGVTQATTTTEIFVKDDGKETEDDSEEVDTYYYENSEILFGTSVNSSGELQGESTEFKLINGKVDVTVYVSNDNAFKTDKFYIDIYDENNNEVDNFDITVKPDWDWVKFTQSFSKKGTYMIDVYNADDTFVNTASITIK